MVASQCGLTPQDVLDGNLDMVQACVEGYQLRLKDQEAIALQGAYFTGYFSRAKRPKPLSFFLKKLYARKAESKTRVAPDVEYFKKLERRMRGELEDV